MAFDSYDSLKSAVADWLTRTDLASQIADCITLAEARINRELRVREMIGQDSATISTQALTIPTDFIEVYRLALDTETDKPLEYRPLEDSESRVGGITSGQPKWFSVVGDEFRFYPAPDGAYTYTLDYYQKVPALSASNTANWLLEKAPDLYLAGSLSEAYGLLLEEERQAYWGNRFDVVKRSMHAAEARSKRTSAPRRMRVVA